MTKEQLILSKVVDFFELCITVGSAATDEFFLTHKSSELICEISVSDPKKWELVFDVLGFRLGELYSAIRQLQDRDEKILLVLELLRQINNYLNYQRAPHISVTESAKEALKSHVNDSVFLMNLGEKFSNRKFDKSKLGVDLLQAEVTAIVKTCIEQFRDSLRFLKEELQLITKSSSPYPVQNSLRQFSSDEAENIADRNVRAFSRKLVYSLKLVEENPDWVFAFLKKNIAEDKVLTWRGNVSQFSFLFHELKIVPRSTLNFFNEGGVTPWSDFVLPHFQRRDKKNNIVQFSLHSVRGRHFSEHKPVPENCRGLERLITEVLIRKV